jgi:hypothetical protein
MVATLKYDHCTNFNTFQHLECTAMRATLEDVCTMQQCSVIIHKHRELLRAMLHSNPQSVNLTTRCRL